MQRAPKVSRTSLIIGWTTVLTVLAVFLGVLWQSPFWSPADALPNSPSVVSVAPSYGAPVGGDTVTIVGAEFTVLTTVLFGGVPSTVTYIDESTLQVETPAHAPGAVDVRIENENGSAIFVQGFLYDNGLSLATINPSRGSPLGGDSITLVGSGFTPALAVRLDEQLLEGITFIDSHNVLVTTPPHVPGPVNVTVSNELGSSTLPGGFTFDAAPTVLSLTPNRGPVSGNTTVTITGTGFTPSDAIFFGTELVLGSTPIDAQTVEVVIPPYTANTVDIIVFGPNGSAVLPQSFEYVPPPTLNQVSPDGGDVGGGTAVNLSGSDFGEPGEAEVFFGGAPATVLAVNGNSIALLTPASPNPGWVTVAVTTAGGSDQLAASYQYTQEGGAAGFGRGDANDDGDIDIADGIFLIHYFFLPPSPAPPCLDAADANDDSGLNISDVIFTISYLFQEGSSPPAPFPDCGPDETADALGCDVYTGC